MNPPDLGSRMLAPTTATVEGGIWDLGYHLRGGKALAGGSSCADGAPGGQNRPVEKHPEI